MKQSTTTRPFTTLAPSGSASPITLSPNYSFLVDQVTAGILDDPTMFEAFAVKMVQQAAFSQAVQNSVLALAASGKLGKFLETRTDPFDSIYISDLKPDILSAKALIELESFKNIADRSAEIQLEDDAD